jgi:GAF domain-containing protein
LLRTRQEWGFAFADGLVRPVEGEWSPEMAASLSSGQTVLPQAAAVGESSGSSKGTLAVPVKVRDRTVGALGFRKGGDRQTWTDREIEVLELLAVQLGDALIGAQLYEAAQEGATRQRLVTELASRMRQTLDVESVLRTAAEEMREALGVPEVVVRLRADAAAAAERAKARAREDNGTGSGLLAEEVGR